MNLSNSSFSFYPSAVIVDCMPIKRLTTFLTGLTCDASVPTDPAKSTRRITADEPEAVIVSYSIGF